MFFLSLCCHSPFLCWDSQSTLPPQDALQHCSDFWTCCGGSSDSNLVLLLCSCLQCPQLSELVCFLLWELSVAFYIFHRHRICLVDHADLIYSLYSLQEDSGSSSLATLPLGFNCGFISTFTCWLSAGVQLLRLPWSTQVCPCEGQLWKWCTCLGRRGSGSTRYSGGLAARAAGNIVLQKGMATSIGQYVPVFLPGEPPL